MSDDESNKGKGLLGGGGLRGGGPPTGEGLLSSGGLASLWRPEDLFSRRKVEGLYFLNKKLSIDGYSFSNCRFDNCTLVVNTSNFDITNCIIDPSCSIEYSNELIKVIQLFNSRYMQSYKVFAPPFVPIKNADGTITIKPGQ